MVGCFDRDHDAANPGVQQREDGAWDEAWKIWKDHPAGSSHNNDKNNNRTTLTTEQQNTSRHTQQASTRNSRSRRTRSWPPCTASRRSGPTCTCGYDNKNNHNNNNKQNNNHNNNNNNNQNNHNNHNH